jgi:Zn-dependent M32 family carboxypeptidase
MRYRNKDEEICALINENERLAKDVTRITREMNRVNALNDSLVVDCHTLEARNELILKHARELIDFELHTEFEDRIKI